MPQTTLEDLHRDWRLVLAKPQRKVVLYNARNNALIVSSPNPSTVTTTTDRELRASSSEYYRSRLDSEEVQVESLDSDEEIITPPPIPTSSQTTTTPTTRSPPNLCPLCYSPLPSAIRKPPTPRQRTLPLSSPQSSLDDDSDEENNQILSRVPTYFQLLSEANSLANTPTTTGQARRGEGTPIAEPPLNHSQFNEGYFSKFFEEVQLLGGFLLVLSILFLDSAKHADR